MPTSLAELEAPLTKALIRHQRLALRMISVMACITLVVAVLLQTRTSMIFAAVFLMGAMMHATDFRLLRGKHAIEERTLFFHALWSGRQAKSALTFYFVFAVCIGTGQLFLQHSLGGLDPLVFRYGTYFPAVGAGEWWRLATGPLLHSGVAHYLVNSMGLLIFGPAVCLAAGSWRGLIAFFTGCSAGALAAYVFNWAGHDSYVGMSGGIFALLGVLAASNIGHRHALPRGLDFLFAWVAAISGVAAEWISSASTVGHLAGFATGVVAAILLCPTAAPVPRG